LSAKAVKQEKISRLKLAGTGLKEREFSTGDSPPATGTGYPPLRE
jgi:hypothetical protein